MSFDDRVNAALQQILSDPIQLPTEFVSALPQIVAQNPVAVAHTSGMRIAKGTKASSVATTGTTFAAGADLLASALQFTAVGGNSYIVRVSAPFWQNSAAANGCDLRLNLDGADAGFVARITSPAINAGVPCVGVGYFTPSAGSHTVNIRLSVSAGTGTVQAGSGGAGTNLPIVVTIEVA